MIIIIYNFIFLRNEKNGLMIDKIKGNIEEIIEEIIGEIIEVIIEEITEENLEEVNKEEITKTIREIMITENKDIRKIIIKIDHKIILEIMQLNKLLRRLINPLQNYPSFLTVKSNLKNKLPKLTNRSKKKLQS